jgi:hypothetical protein
VSALDRSHAFRTLRATAWVLGVAAALAQAIVYRDWVNADSTSYLDMSDGVTTGEWSRLVNATWSPLYPALVGVVRLFSSSPAWDFPAAHLINFLSFLFAFAAFEYLLRALLPDRGDAVADGPAPLPPLLLTAVGYALFLWASIGMTSLMKPTPDLLMSAFLYLAVGLLLRIGAGRDDARTCALLGVVLGLGYLAKAFMFPLGIVMLGMTLLFGGSVAQRVRRPSIAGAVMLLVAAPYIVAVSTLAGHPTFGDAGKVVHLTYVDHANPPGFWTWRNDASGRLERPARRIFSNPTVYAFPQSAPSVTRSVWYDPALGARGLRTGFRLWSQVEAVRASLRVYRDVVLETAALLVAIVLLAVAARGRGVVAAIGTAWPAWVTSVAALAAYALIHVETRYIGPLFLMLWLALLVGFRPARPLPPTLTRAAAVVIVLNLAIITGIYARRDYDDNRGKTELGDLEAGRALNALGIAPGSRVARINYVVADGWARLGRVSIIAEVQRSHVDAFWKAAPDVRRQVLDSLAATGARAAVAHLQPKYGALSEGWVPLGRSQYAAYLLAPPREAMR